MREFLLLVLLILLISSSITDYLSRARAGNRSGRQSKLPYCDSSFDIPEVSLSFLLLLLRLKCFLWLCVVVILFSLGCSVRSLRFRALGGKLRGLIFLSLFKTPLGLSSLTGVFELISYIIFL